ncbi:MAG: lipid A deacylase LpxR family protein [Candidatus Aminicenantes bacterium]|jgi:hypothetical protein
MREKVLLTAVLVGLFFLLQTAQAKDGKGLSTFWICWENDTLINTDRGFTNGFKLTWISQNINNPRNNGWYGGLPFVNKYGYTYAFSFSLRQDMFTPEDLKRVDLDVNDRPYAGYLAFELGIHSLNRNHMVFFSLSLGVVGPIAMAGKAQRFVHSFSRSPTPQGWQHQLKNELAVQVQYQNKWRLAVLGRRKGFGLDFIPHVGGGLGNVYTYACTGLQMRLGWNLPHDFGVSLLRPGGSSGVGYFDRDTSRAGREYDGIYLFAAVDEQFVLRNIFLDGNTLQESHSVNKEKLTGNLQLGFGFRVSYFNVKASYVFWSKLYKTQKHRQEYIIIGLSLSF